MVDRKMSLHGRKTKFNINLFTMPTYQIKLSLESFHYVVVIFSNLNQLQLNKEQNNHHFIFTIYLMQ